MRKYQADIIIFGAGIAGLWVFNRLRRAGYNTLLLEKNLIGGGQTIAAQGIVHSGLKYKLATLESELTKNIAAMPQVWHSALQGNGAIDLRTVKLCSDSQYLLVPGGMVGGIVKLAAKAALGGTAAEVPQDQWPESITGSGFKGSVIRMGEPVLDMPSVIRALAEQNRDSIRKVSAFEIDGNTVRIDDTEIHAKILIFTSAAANENFAKDARHSRGLQTQKRPLLMVIMRGAPFDLCAHMVGTSDKPEATITTHYTHDGERVWYIGGAVAERTKEASPNEAYAAAQAVIVKYLPQADISRTQWAVLPIDRVEGKSAAQGFMPNAPTLHAAGNCFYCWPTKMTFAPMLSDMIFDRLNIRPSGERTDWTFLPAADYAAAPWDEAEWTNLKKENSAKQG